MSELSLPKLFAGTQDLDHHRLSTPLPDREQGLVSSTQHLAQHGTTEINSHQVS
ncbi:hypothetical protein ABZ863_22570 [Saccharomonospora sp. NPDC046836]|uniref:hypothetical protein n=1 Tax=Saccharomonospora sp. NPDC046836 TaxID=3156921 RepID=UPI0033FFAFCE